MFTQINPFRYNINHLLSDLNHSKATSLETKMENLIDLIKIRIKDNSIDSVAAGLLVNVFDVRNEFVHWINTNASVESYLAKMNEVVSQEVQKASFSLLDNKKAQYLLLFNDIINNIVNNVDYEKRGNIDVPLDYDTVNQLKYFPSPQLKYFSELMNASLEFDFALILSGLVMDQKVSLSKTRIKEELIPFLRSGLVKFAANATHLGLWEPDKDDYSPLINRIKIYVSMIESDNGKSTVMTKDELVEFINSV